MVIYLTKSMWKYKLNQGKTVCEKLTLQTVKELQRDVARLHEPYL